MKRVLWQQYHLQESSMSLVVINLVFKLVELKQIHLCLKIILSIDIQMATDSTSFVSLFYF
jgi:hypothetical protein